MITAAKQKYTTDINAGATLMAKSADAGSMADNDILNVQHLSIFFGGLVAVDDVSFKVRRNSITAIIGPNGAGKTTVFNCLTGFYKPAIGAINLTHSNGSEFMLERHYEHEICAKAKVARTFQNIRIFGGMTILENLMVAQHRKLMAASGWTIGGILGLSSYHRQERQAVDKALYWLDKVGLTERCDEMASNLSYGDQRRLEIIRAMCTEPELICLDEPAAGLNNRESSELSDLIKFIRKEHDKTILLIEHDMSVVMEISDHIIVLDCGRKIADGSPDEIKNNPDVIAAYLGSADDDDDDA